MSLQNFFKIDRIINILIAFGFSVGSAFGSLFQLLSTTNATNCVPGKQIKIECNPCVCNQDGRSYSCTLMNCSPHNVLRRLVTRPASNCKVSGVTFRNDCNNCYCQEPGLALCTNYGCTSCFPLARFWRGCQFCVCNRDGFSMVCTDRYCSTRRERATTCKSATRFAPSTVYAFATTRENSRSALKCPCLRADRTTRYNANATHGPATRTASTQFTS